MLIVSYIKPWSKSDNFEKVDSDDGLLLCPHHDVVFDKGLISFDDDGKIIISKKLSQEDAMLLNSSDKQSIKLSPETLTYIKYHRAEIFEKH